MEITNYFLYLLFAFLPSILWLLFYLRKDEKPEPKLMILKVFFFGMVFALLALFFQIILLIFLKFTNLPQNISQIIEIFLIVAFIEEFLKFLVVKIVVFKSKELDEPVDGMIYMIVSALGFATTENLLLFFQYLNNIWDTLATLSLLRFLSATLLHTLSSAILGFFVGLSILKKKKMLTLITIGILLATSLHGTYNLFIIKGEEKIVFIILFAFLLISMYIVLNLFKKIKQKK